MNNPAVKDRMQELGVAIVAAERRSPDYLQKFVDSEIAKWAAAIEAAGISMDGGQWLPNHHRNLVARGRHIISRFSWLRC